MLSMQGDRPARLGAFPVTRAEVDIAGMREVLAKMTPAPWHDVRDAARRMSGDDTLGEINFVVNLDDGDYEGCPGGKGGIAIMWGKAFDEAAGDIETPTTREEDVVGVIAIVNSAGALLDELEELRKRVSELEARTFDANSTEYNGA